MNTLQDKVVLVTGGSRGIGRAVVEACAAAGARVAFTYKSSSQAADEIARTLTAGGADVRAHRNDASVPAEAAALVETVVKDFGRLDVLVNNAGITRDGLLMRMSEEDWDAVIANNLKSVYSVTKAAIRPMMSQRSGKIITITSVVGLTGNAGQANYAASKAGVIGFTKSVAKELGSRNIQVNAVAPSFVETDMTAKLTDEQRDAVLAHGTRRGIAQPDQVAGFVVFLASDDSDLVTGQTFIVEAQHLAAKGKRPAQLLR